MIPRCPKCHRKKMELIMEEVMGEFWRCANCGHEVERGYTSIKDYGFEPDTIENEYGQG